MKTITQRNAAIDLAKYIASIFIIGIHTGFFSDINQTLAFVFQNIIFRTAVPFFAVCTGFFLLPGFVIRKSGIEAHFSVMRKS